MGKVLAGSMPNRAASSTLAVTAMKCWETEAALPPLSRNHCRASRLFSRVSWVRKDF